MIGGVSIGILEKLLGQVSIVSGVCAEPGADQAPIAGMRIANHRGEALLCSPAQRRFAMATRISRFMFCLHLTKVTHGLPRIGVARRQPRSRTTATGSIERTAGIDMSADPGSGSTPLWHLSGDLWYRRASEDWRVDLMQSLITHAARIVPGTQPTGGRARGWARASPRCRRECYRTLSRERWREQSVV